MAKINILNKLFAATLFLLYFLSTVGDTNLEKLFKVFP